MGLLFRRRGGLSAAGQEPPSLRRSVTPPPAIPFVRDLNTPLLKLGPSQGDDWQLRHAFEGVHVTGSTGSGKSSGSGRHLALSYLRAGFGGIVLCAKSEPGEWDVWQEYAEQTGRSAQLIRFDDQGVYRFNFLEYAALTNLDGKGRLITMNLVELIMKMSEAASRGDELQGRAAEQPFWKLAPRELLSHAIDALWAAWGRLKLDEIVQLILTAPRKPEDFTSDKARENSFCLQTLHRAAYEPANPIEPRDLFIVLQYFQHNFATLDPETRSNIVTTMTSQFTPFLKGVMRELFCTETTIVPELTHEGAIIVLDLPVDRFREAGMMAQHLFKYLWQVATLRRDTREAVRPCFCWADEAQNFITPFDMQFQAVARSNRACTVYLTQTVSNYIAMIGGGTPRETTMAFLANFVTKIFHRNDDHATNEMAAEMIGRNLQLRAGSSRGFTAGEGRSRGDNQGWSSGSSSSYGNGGGGSINSGFSGGTNSGVSFNSGFSVGSTLSEQMDFEIQPGAFGYLRSGGPENGLCVEGVWFQAGRRFRANRGRNFLSVAFDQRVR